MDPLRDLISLSEGVAVMRCSIAVTVVLGAALLSACGSSADVTVKVVSCESRTENVDGVRFRPVSDVTVVITNASQVQKAIAVEGWFGPYLAQPGDALYSAKAEGECPAAGEALPVTMLSD